MIDISKSSSLRWKILLPLLFGGIVLGFLASWLTYQSALQQLRDQYVERGHIVAASIRELASASIKSNQATAVNLRTAIEDFVKIEPNVQAMTLQTLSPKNILISTLQGKTEIHDPSLLGMFSDIREAHQTGRFGYYFSSNGSLITLLPLWSPTAQKSKALVPLKAVSNTRQGTDIYYELDQFSGVVRVQMDWNSVFEASSSLLWKSAISTASLVGLILLIASMLVVRHVLVPMSRIHSVLKAQDHGEGQARVPDLEAGEINGVGKALNSMLETLNDRDQLLRAFVDNVPSTIVLKDSDGRYLMANQKWHDRFNPVGADIRGKSALEFHGKEFMQMTEDEDRRIIETGQYQEYEREYKFPDGRVLISSIQKFPVQDSGGMIIAVGVIDTDITKRKEEERELLAYRQSLEKMVEKRQQEVAERTQDLQVAHEKLEAEYQNIRMAEERFRTFAESASDWYWEMDSKLRFTYLSEGFSRVTELKVENLLGKTRQTAGILGVAPSALDKHLQTVENHEVFRNFTYFHIKQDGDIVWISTNGVPVFDEYGIFLGYRGTGSNITAIKQAELDLLEAKEMAESASLAKTNFLATMSHEIRTPLNGVLGLAELLLNSDLDPEQLKKIETILSSGKTLLSIINDILDVSRIEAGGVELEERAFVLRDLISSITSPFQNLSDGKDLTLTTVDEIDSTMVLVGDPVRLRQILWNLLSNAIKFTSEGGVSLTIEELEHADERVSEVKDRLVHFVVEDTGVGIASDRVDAVFDAFTQEDNTISRKFGGTGLGLSIVKQLTEMMGGTLTAESTLGKGSRFDVYLPFFNADAADISSMSKSNESRTIEQITPMKILVAEDNAVNAMIATGFLERFGHQVRHVENGRLAVEAVAENWADLVLMDIHMPEMDGIEATKRIRLSKKSADLPIIGLTAEAFTERHAHFMDVGMNGVITKPFTGDQLADALARFCKSEQRNPGVAPETVDIVEDDKTAGEESDASNQHANPVGDIQKLDDLRQQLSPEIVTLLLNEGSGSLQANLENIRTGVATFNPEVIRSSAHSIKGSCGSLFAVRISLLAAEIEESANDIDAVQKLKPALEQAAEKTLEWWKQEMQ